MADPHKKRKRVLRYAGRRSCDDGGRHWSDAFKSQGMLSAADNIIRCQKGAKKNLSRISSRLTTLLAPSFWTSGLQDCKQKKKILLFLAAQVVIILFGIPRKTMGLPRWLGK